MIEHIKIKNFSIIKTADIQMSPGFNVISGESGAGKSLLLSIIRFAFGARTAKSMIGQWGEKAKVSIQLKTRTATNYGSSILVEHEMSISKRTVKINQQLVSQADIQMLAKVLLLDCQQSIEQAFKQPSYQQSLLDQLIDQKVLQRFNMSFKTLQDLEDTYHRIENHTLHQDDIDLMRYHAQELEQALEGIASIEGLVEMVSGGKRSQQVANELKHLDESLRLCHKKLSCITDDIEDVTGPMLISKKLPLEESIDIMRHELSDLFEQQEIVQQDMLHAKEQLEQLRELGRKHRRPVEQLPEVYETLCQKLEDIESAEEKLPKLSMQIKKQQLALQSSSDLLYQARLEVSQMIEKTFNESVAFLGMADASCDINVYQAEFKLNGGQMMEIMFKNNQRKQATSDFNQLSGGELSRVSLLFQILCSKQSILLLDEVDTGLSGDAAKLVRKFLQKMAKKSQIVAISHLAAVAAGANTHFLVKKHRDNGVYSTIDKLSVNSVVSEISRMLGGKQTKISIAHAHECLSDAETT